MPTGPLRADEAGAMAAPAKKNYGKFVSCHWCGGGGDDPYFGGQTNTCQTCGGAGGYYEADAKFMGDPRYRNR